MTEFELHPITEGYVDAIGSLARIHAGATAALNIIAADSPAHTFLQALKEEAETGLKINGDTHAG